MLRAAVALAALAVVCAQDVSNVVPGTINIAEDADSNEIEDVEQRYTPELIAELKEVKYAVLLLYTEYSSKNTELLKYFISNLTASRDQTFDSLRERLEHGPSKCREAVHLRMKKLHYDYQKAARFSADNHHKFLLGHIIVMRMHLNKSEDYIKKCKKAVGGCGKACESTKKLKRWRNQALNEIHRVKEDIEHSRRSFKDLLTHARRKHKNLYRQAKNKIDFTTNDYDRCVQEGVY